MANLPEWALPIRDEMARELAGYLGPVSFDGLAQGKRQFREWQRETCDYSTDYTQEDLLEEATAALAVALPLIAEHMAGVADNHAKHAWDIGHELGQNDACSSGRRYGANAIAAAIRQEVKAKNAE